MRAFSLLKLCYQKLKKLNHPIITSILMWLVIILFFQYVDPFLTISRCSFDDDIVHSLNNGNRATKILLIADPQLIDAHTYPDRPSLLLSLSKITVDNYLYKNYIALITKLEPEMVIFLGDLLDNGRESADDYYEREFNRFTKLFIESVGSKKLEIITNIPGNHDIGWENGVTKHSLGRFEENFGHTNKVIEKGNHELILFNTQTLSNTDDPIISASSKEFLKGLSKKMTKKTRFLFTHVPLWRDINQQTCGKMRESNKAFPITKGYQYQTVLDAQTSQEILESIRPEIIFSGDDHDYCELVHSFNDDTNHQHKAIGVVVKSMSMAMGIKNPAVELLTLYDNPIELAQDWRFGKDIFKSKGESIDFSINMCYMTKPYVDIASFILFAIINAFFLLANCYKKEKHYSSILEIDRTETLINKMKQNIRWIDFVKLAFIASLFVIFLFYTVTYITLV